MVGPLFSFRGQSPLWNAAVRAALPLLRIFFDSSLQHRASGTVAIPLETVVVIAWRTDKSAPHPTSPSFHRAHSIKSLVDRATRPEQHVLIFCLRIVLRWKVIRHVQDPDGSRLVSASNLGAG